MSLYYSDVCYNYQNLVFLLLSGYVVKFVVKCVTKFVFWKVRLDGRIFNTGGRCFVGENFQFVPLSTNMDKNKEHGQAVSYPYQYMDQGLYFGQILVCYTCHDNHKFSKI